MIFYKILLAVLNTFLVDYRRLPGAGRKKGTAKMPNKRKKDKRLVAGWVRDGEAEEFKALAESLGITVTDLLTQLIREELRRSKSSKNQRSVKSGK